MPPGQLCRWGGGGSYYATHKFNLGLLVLLFFYLKRPAQIMSPIQLLACVHEVISQEFHHYYYSKRSDFAGIKYF
jgi:hypothetical protein